MRDKMLKKLAHLHATRPWQMFIIMLAITAILFIAASQLKINMRTSDLLPESDPKVIEFNKVIDEFTTAANLIIVVQGEEERIKTFADSLVPCILALKDMSNNNTLKTEIKEIQEKIDLLEKEKLVCIIISRLLFSSLYQLNRKIRLDHHNAC